MKIGFGELDKTFGGLRSAPGIDPENDTAVVLIVGPDGTVKGGMRTSPGSVRLVPAGTTTSTNRDGKSRTLKWDDHYSLELGNNYGGQPLRVDDDWTAVVKGKVQIKPNIGGMRVGRGQATIDKAEFAARIAAKRAASRQ